MTAPPITALPSAPNRTSPGSTFSADAAAFVAALSTLVGELNSLGAWLNSNALLAYEWGDGSAAAPSVHPASDDTLGMFFSENSLGLAIAGVQKFFLDGSELQLDVELTGTAAQADGYDDTVGRLLKLGADAEGVFGLGATGTLDNLGDWQATGLPSGFYIFNSNTANKATDKPSGYSDTDFGIVQVLRYSPNFFTLIAWRGAGAALASPQIRRYYNGSWTNWVKDYLATDVVGTVAQSSGVPTGGLFEYGSNANGKYIRFADGTQICWKTLTGLGPVNNTYGSAFGSASIGLGTLPASFAAAPARALAPWNAIASRCHVEPYSQATTTDGGGCYLVRMISSAQTDYAIDAIFIGRWY